MTQQSRLNQNKNRVYDFSAAKNFLIEKIKALQKNSQRFSKGNRHRCLRVEVNIESQCIFSWLSRQTDEVLLYWSDREKKFQIGGVGVADEVVLNHKEYSPLFRKIKQQLSQADQDVRYYGGIAFAGHNLDSEWNSFGSGRFWLPRFEIIKNKNETIFICNLILDQDKKDSFSEVLRQLKKLNIDPSHSSEVIPDLLSRQDYPDYASWIAIARDALESLQSDGHHKIVLARKTVLKLVAGLNPFIFLREVKRKTNNCFCFCFQPKYKNAFFGASPEQLYHRYKRAITSEAIAGTRPRGLSPGEDDHLAIELVNSQKDLLEHEYVVQFLKTNFKTLCRNFKVTESQSVLRLKEGMHLLSRVQGILKKKYFESDLIKNLHPTPAVGGKPNRWAIPMISFYEPFVRGWYAGPVGWVGKDDAQFVVAIRSALLQDDQLSLYSGAGIVTGSNPYSEWQEIEHKMSSFIKMFRNHEDKKRFS